MAGHVFITRSDLTTLKCDAWLLPTDTVISVSPRWTASLASPLRQYITALRHHPDHLPEAWRDDGVRVLRLPIDGQGPSCGQPYLTNVGGYRTTPMDWYIEGARQFCTMVIEDLQANRLLPQRATPLIGLPVIGTGQGGASGSKGTVVRHLIDMLHEVAADHEIDIVLVIKNNPMFIAAQNARRQFLRERSAVPIWSDLGPDLEREAARLAALAVMGQLVLFIGAGVSRGAGLPDWQALLDDLAVDAGMRPREREALRRLHDLDRARIIQGRLAALGRSIGEVVAGRLTAPRFSLAHSLLASLPVSEAVTTNYDTLFEEASAAAGRATAVLPYHPIAGNSRWLLKLHGSVTHPEDIVLTREDYLRYGDRRAALAGIVQALLITRHMLFIGFSLRDDNFHRIVDDVRKAIGQTAHGTTGMVPFGTVLQLRSDELLAELWRSDLMILSTGVHGDASPSGNDRRLEIFLDRVLSHATQGMSPLLDPSYDGVLTEDEREIRALLCDLEQRASPSARHSRAWLPIADLMQRLGAQPASD